MHCHLLPLPPRLQAHSTSIVSPKAAAAAAKQRWRRLLCLAWEVPFDLSGEHQLQEMEQQAQRDAKQQKQQQQTTTGGSNTVQQHSTAAAAVQDARHGQTETTTGHHGATYKPRANGAMSAAQQEHQLPFQGKQRKPQRPDMLVLDLPWIYHWPKFLLWLLFEGCHLALAVGESLTHSERECVAYTVSHCFM
jgi:hypothetical protein